MIQELQAAVKESWLLKGFLGLVMISFAIWGVGDAINPVLDPNVAIKVDQVEIRAEEIQRRFSGQVEELRNAIGPDFTAKDAAELGVMDSIIEQESMNASIQMAARDMNLVVSDEALRKAVENIEAFQDETGNFSPVILSNVLLNNGLTEQAFINLIRGDVVQQTMLQPVADNAKAPQTMIDVLFQYRAEQRTAKVLFFNKENFPADKKPSEGELRETYNSNVHLFTAPEYRNVEAVLIKTTDLVPRSSILQDEIQLFYEENISRYSTEPTRNVNQLIFISEEEALNAFNQLADGDTLETLSKKLGIESPIDLGTLTPSQIVGFDLQPIFDITDKSISEPVETDFGWHLFEITDLSTGSIKALPVVKDEIIDFLIQDKALDEMYEATIYLEDELAAGVTMREIGATPAFNYLELGTFDRNGRNQSGLKTEIPFEEERFLRQVFSSESGVESEVTEMDDYAYVYKVISIIEPSPKPFVNIEDEVEKIWKEKEIADAVKTKAVSVKNNLGPSSKFTSLAENDKQIEFANLGPLRRFGDSISPNFIIPARFVSSELLTKLFDAEIGDIIEAAVDDGHVVARLDEILMPNSDEYGETRKQIAANVSDVLASDLVKSFTDSITADYDVVINQETISQLIPE